MSLDPPAVAALFVEGYAGISRSLVVAGLALAVGGTVRFLRERPSVAVAAADSPSLRSISGAAALVRGAGPALVWPFVLIVAGFCVGDHLLPRTFVTGLSLGLAVSAPVGVAWHLLRRSAGRHGYSAVPGPALAALAAVSTLLLFGFLLVVRLGPARIPEGTVEALLGDSRFADARNAIGLPLGVLGVSLGAALAWPLLKRCNFLTWPLQYISRCHESHRGRFYFVALFLIAVTFILPKFFNSLGPIYTFPPEFGKLLYCLILAWFVADYASVYRNGVAWTRQAGLAARVWYPALLFIAVAFASVVKKDVGPLIPLLVATMAVLGSVLYHHAGRALDADRPGREGQRWARLWQYGKPLVLVLGMLVAIAGVVLLVFMPYIRTRFVIMLDPWTYTWQSACLPPDTVVAHGVPAPPVPAAPAGYTPCQVSYAAGEAEHRSQMARGLAIIADGGLWGRGLGDTTAGVLQAGDSDFVLAVIWSKLGGVTVLLLAALTALLARALGRIGPPAARFAAGRGTAADRARASRGALEPSRLFATAIGAMVFGQFLFVFATIQNFFAQSGITAPFLSRGGSSTAVLGLAVFVAVALRLHAASQPHPVLGPDTAVPILRRWRRPANVALVLCCSLMAFTIVAPYRPNGADRPYCGPTQNMVDSGQCSMDRVAASRRSIELSLGGTIAYRWNTAAGSWVAQEKPGVAAGDLDGLLNTDGENAGLLDSALLSLAAPAAPGTLADRLGAPRQDTRTTLELTVSPKIQHTTATALRADLDDSAPLAGGAVVLDARSGRVLAMSSAPTALHAGAAKAAAPDSGAAAQDFERRQEFGPRHADGTIAAMPGCATVEHEKAMVDAAANCWAWRLQKAPEPAPDPQQEAEQRRYVAGDPRVALPSVDQDRAAGYRYGLGSAFKVVVASAYLRQPGTTAHDLLPAPETIPDGGRLIRNYNRGECPGTVRGQISLTAALAVSCNTAFVRLAQQLGWPAIRETALDFGFNDAGQRGTAWLADINVGLSSSVSGSTDAPGSAGLGNNVLGGGETEGTPLQMATVMAGIANHGLVVQPQVVLAPGVGTAGPVTGKQVLTASQADQLRTALADTTVAGGTASALRAPDGRQLWIKTGTHDPSETTAPSAGNFVRQIAWLVGFVETAAGPVSFAVAVETRDEKAGSTRARLLVQQIIASIVEDRG